MGTNAGHERFIANAHDDGLDFERDPVGSHAARSNLADDQSAHVGTNAGHSGERAHVDDEDDNEPTAHVGTPALSNFDRERIRSQARMALVGLGYRIGVAGKAVDLVIQSHYTLEDVIRAALRSCACTT